MEKNKNQDNFLRVFDNVKKSKKFKGLTKLLFSDILSFQLEGKVFKKMDKTIAYDYGISKYRAQKEIKLVKESGEIDVRHEFIPKKPGERPTKVRFLTVKDPSKWTFKASDGISANNERADTKKKAKVKPKSSENNPNESNITLKKNDTPSESKTNLNSNDKTNSEPATVSDSVIAISKIEKGENLENVLPEVVLTDEKKKWVLNSLKKQRPSITQEDIDSLDPEVISTFLYDDNGIWQINNETQENTHQIRKIYNGGSRCTIQNLNSKNEHIEINKNKLEEILSEEKIGFSDIDIKNYYIIKQRISDNKLIYDN